MKNFWKAVGAAALIAGLTPYRVTTDKATGDKKIRALLWRATCSTRPETKGVSVDIGFFPPNEVEEAHLFADELIVHYHNGQPCYVDDDAACQSECCCQESACSCQDSAPAESAPAENTPEQDAPQESAPSEAPEDTQQP